MLSVQHLSQSEDVRYLGIHLDWRLTWKQHIQAKMKQLGHELLYWLIGRKLTLPLLKKVLVYKAVLEPLWWHGLQLWETASHSNIEIIQSFPSYDH